MIITNESRYTVGDRSYEVHIQIMSVIHVNTSGNKSVPLFQPVSNIGNRFHLGHSRYSSVLTLSSETETSGMNNYDEKRRRSCVCVSQSLNR